MTHLVHYVLVIDHYDYSDVIRLFYKVEHPIELLQQLEKAIKTALEYKIFQARLVGGERARTIILDAFYRARKELDEDQIREAFCIEIDIGDPDFCTRWFRHICIAKIVYDT